MDTSIDDGMTRVPSRAARSAAALARFIWQVVLPLLGAGLVLRYAVPTPAEAQGTWAERLARIGSDHAVAMIVVLFLVFSGMARYWSGHVLENSARPTASTTAGVGGLVLVVAIALAAAFGFRNTVGAYRVESSSMLPTLEPDDLLEGKRLAGAFHFGSWSPPAPERGEVVVFDRPSGINGPDRLIKRVIGLPGDHISMNGPHPVINGWEVPSCDAGPYFFPVSEGGASGRLAVEFLGHRAYLVLYSAGDAWQGAYDVKPGEAFLLGDNRSNSSDSRAWNRSKGGGLAFQSIEARVDRWLVGVHRNDHVDFDHLLEPLDLSVRLDGLDTGVQRDGVRHCLAGRPAQTEPPTHAGD